MRNANGTKDDADLYYWLKILANSIYGFFVELIPEHFKQPQNVMVFSGDAIFPDSARVTERRGKWFAPYLATLITSAGRLLLAMLEIEVTLAGGTHLYCDPDSLAIVSLLRASLSSPVIGSSSIKPLL